jgi:hypothetical protein
MKNLLILLVFMAAISPVISQTSKKPVKQQTSTPKLGVYLGSYPTGDISAEQFKDLVDSAITVIDEKGNKYAVSRFRINYIFISTYRDHETDQEKTVRDLRVSDFYDTPLLSDEWKGSIRDNAKKGDEVIINNVIVKLKNGKKIMVPEWKVTLN